MKAEVERRGLIVRMPALNGYRKQLTAGEVCASRFVTKIRWAVEAVRGIITQKYRILDHRVEKTIYVKRGCSSFIIPGRRSRYVRFLRSSELFRYPLKMRRLTVASLALLALDAMHISSEPLLRPTLPG